MKFTELKDLLESLDLSDQAVEAINKILSNTGEDINDETIYNIAQIIDLDADSDELIAQSFSDYANQLSSQLNETEATLADLTLGSN